MIAVGLRLKRRGKKSRDELISLIEETLAHDDATFDESQDIGRLARAIGRFSDPSQATTWFLEQKTLEQLKTFCKVLRLPVSGKKAVLAEQFTVELLDIWKVVHSPAVASAAAPGTTLARAGAPAASSPGARRAAASRDPRGVDAPEAEGPEGLERPCARGFAEPDGTRLGDQWPERARPDAAAAMPAVVEAEPYPASPFAREHSSGAEDPAALDQPGAALEVEVSVVDDGAPAQPGMHRDRSLYAAPADAAVPEVSIVETQAMASAEEQQDRRRERRKAERRMKLMGYMVEEVATVYGGEKDRYMADMERMLQQVPDEARMAYCSDRLHAPTQALVRQRVPSVLGDLAEPPEFGAWHSEPHQYQMHMVGEVGPSRQAWCKWWDGSTGCGELVDLVDSNPVAVVSAALSTGANVSPRLKSLRQGEFVEYRRVDRGPDLIARAVLVRGIKGWPLMCEVDTSRVLEP